MSAISTPQVEAAKPQSRLWLKVLAITIPVTLLGVLASPDAPLGGFWPMPAAATDAMGMDMTAAPAGIQLPLLIILKLIESITLGLGVSFLVFGYPLLRALSPASKRLTFATYLAIGWLLISWWTHDGLHQSAVGSSISGLLYIEYIFHVTLQLAGLIVAAFFINVLRNRSVQN